jgi:LacI family transcriptional regulator
VNDKAIQNPFMPRRSNPKPTMKEVAALAGVSVQTVSFVVNSNPIITPETRQRVLDAIQQLGYTPDASARSLRSGRSRVLGLLIPDVHNPHFWAILDGAEQEARTNGYSLILATTSMQRERERQAFDALARQHLDGLILLFTYPEDFTTDIAHLRQNRLPVVVDGAQFSDVDRVWFHYRASARELMEHLFTLGHRRIAFIQGVGRQDFPAGQDRTDTYHRKMEEHGIPVSERIVIPCGNSLEDGFFVANQMLERSPHPTAIVGMNDLMAYGAMQAALQRGLRVPEDVSIAGFDDDAMFRVLAKPLTTGSVDGAAFGVQAVQLILNRLHNPELPPQKAHVASHLVVRQSTGVCQPPNC